MLAVLKKRKLKTIHLYFESPEFLLGSWSRCSESLSFSALYFVNALFENSPQVSVFIPFPVTELLGL